MATPDVDPAVKEQVEKLAKVTKKGFDLKARLQGRGLRKGSVTLFLDEEKGLELGWAHDLRDPLGNIVFDKVSKKPIRVRRGVEGDLDSAIELKASTEEAWNEAKNVASVLGDAEKKKAEKELGSLEDALAPIEQKIADLTERRDKLIEEMREDGIVVKLRAVPKVIQKDTHRRAKETLKITGKVPDDEESQDRFNDVKLAHLMTVMIQEVVENTTGDSNDGVTYEDAIDMIGWLPDGQFKRLDAAMGRVQFTDSISTAIEGQEDFS